MQRVTRLVVIGLIAIGSVFMGFTGPPAQAASPLGCPTLCLTGGLLGLGGRSVAVTGVHAASPEHRDYSFQWLAIDLTEFPPVQVTLTVDFSVDGDVSNGIFTGAGEVDISSAGCGYCMEMEGVSFTDTGLLITATGSDSGQSFTFLGTVVGGGVATYQADYDYDWQGCGDC